MSIIRAPRPETKFYTLDKAISEDERLSWAARGLLIFLLGKPDNWEVSVAHLIKQTSKAIGKSSGRDAVRVIIKELESAGYMAVDRARGDGGSFNGMDYTVCERPQTDNPSMGSPQTENPATAKPAPAKPSPENPPLIKNDFEQPTEEEAKTDVKHCAPPADAEGIAAKVVALIQKPRCEIPADMPGPKDPECKTFKAWANYAMAYRKRYDAWPVWNAKVAGQVGQLIARLGADIAHHVAAYFLTINDARLINGCHNLGDLLTKAEAYHTQWVTNRQMNSTTARQLEQTQANINAAQEASSAIRNNGSKGNAFMR